MTWVRLPRLPLDPAGQYENEHFCTRKKQMNLLEEVFNQPHLNAPKGIIYGPPGIGKTTFGAGSQNPIIVDCENGANYVRCHRTPYLTTWQDIKRWLDFLAFSEHPYETVVVDSVDWLLRRTEEHVAGVNGDFKNMERTLNRSQGGYRNGKQVLKNYVYQYLMPVLDAIVNRGVSVLLLAHATRQTMTNIDGVILEKSVPEIHPELISNLIEWSDFVGAARLNGNSRELVLKETNQLLAKNRYGIENAIPLNWDALIHAINQNLQLSGEQNNG